MEKIIAAFWARHRAQALRPKLDEWIESQQAELDEFEDRNESAEMQGSLDAFEAVRTFIDTGAEPLFMTLGTWVP